ncbi:MAG: response regulator [Blastomonas fulva]|uniref:response regulator n=1 Tax=Blastomonas fulva TaxID=1550728 RepID=UPI0024E1AB00|nr:response regulator [Blastomonas fulva]MDK2758960.1 response regulator [Blastomonas fulva]
MNGTMSAPVGAALRSSFTVLVSDDDPAVRRSLHMMLCAYGYDVQSYTSGQALLADPCAAAADCLVIDYRMPDVDGVTVLQGLRARGWRGRAILVSAYCDCALAAKARASGFDDVIAKPFIARAVREAIGSYLRPGR